MPSEYCDTCSISIPYNQVSEHKHFWSDEDFNAERSELFASGLDPSCEECGCLFSLPEVNDYRLDSNGADPDGFPRVCSLCL